MPTERGIEKYRDLLRRLLPIGRAWEQVKSNLLLKAAAIEYCRVEERASVLLDTEMDPASTDELLTDWETTFGIPDECTPADQTINERRVQLQQKIASTKGAINAQFYIDLAEDLGFDDVTIDDAVRFTVGRARVGDRLTNSDPPRSIFRVGTGRVGDQLKTPGWAFFFIIDIPATELEKFRVGTARVGDPLVSFGNELLECTIRKLKPAHDGAFFTFGV